MVDGAFESPKLNANAFQAPEEQNLGMACLPDDLLVEIFFRLPCTQSVIQCKCICKSWAALISSPHFKSRFAASKEGSYAVVARVRKTRLSRATWKGKVFHLRDPVNFNLQSFSVSSLPYLVDGDASDLTVVAACNDLLLYCGNKFKDRFNFYICNVQTRQWVQLPSLLHVRGSWDMIGLICDPYYSYEGGNPSSNNIIVNDPCRYSVVVVFYKDESASKFSARLFSSNSTGSQWTEIVLSLPRQSSLLPLRSSFCFAGMLHFRCSNGLFSIDPYSGVKNNPDDGTMIIKCHLIPQPPGYRFGGACVVVHHGCLNMFGINDYHILQMWVLKDYMTGEWSLKHKIAINEFVPLNPCLAEHLQKDSLNPFIGFVLGQHPINPDIIYVLGPHWIVLCNAQKRTMEVACHISASSSSMKLHPYFNGYQLELPIWPTPLQPPYCGL